MNRPPPRPNDDHVESPIESLQLGPGADVGACRPFDPTSLARADGLGRRRRVAARLDLDEGNDAEPLGDYVDFSERTPEAAGQHPIPKAPQVKYGDRFSPPPEPPGLPAPVLRIGPVGRHRHFPFSSRARR